MLYRIFQRFIFQFKETVAKNVDPVFNFFHDSISIEAKMHGLKHFCLFVQVFETWLSEYYLTS